MSGSSGGSGHHLAQLNIGRARGTMDEPVMAGFAGRLAEINALGESSPGYVWRLTDEAGGDATSIHPFEDPRIIVNLTVWRDIDSLYEFAYRTRHKELLRTRRDWFEPLDGPHLVLWWVPAGHIPTIDEARARLDHLAAHGPSAHAFTFKDRFEPAAATAS